MYLTREKKKIVKEKSKEIERNIGIFSPPPVPLSLFIHLFGLSPVGSVAECIGKEKMGRVLVERSFRGFLLRAGWAGDLASPQTSSQANQCSRRANGQQA